jgi:hypothetical protein
MDRDAALQDIDRFIGLLRVVAESRPGNVRNGHYERDEQQRRAQSEINQWRPVIEAYASEVAKDLVEPLGDALDRDLASLAATTCERLVGTISKRERIEAVLGTQGPKLAASDMHPWVWEEAAPRLDAGFFRDALQAAANRIFDVELPKKLQVQPSPNPADLFAAFAPDKRSGVILRFPDVDPADPSWAMRTVAPCLLDRAVLRPFEILVPTG